VLGLVQHFDLDLEKLSRFLSVIENGYNDCPYHNSAHATSVVHVMYALLVHGGLAEALAPIFRRTANAQLLTMACLLAAVMHDYQHLGLSNDFLVKTMHERALRYNDEHVNEQHHVAAAFEVLRRPDCNFLEKLPVAEFRWLRSIVIKLVLGTDMANHGSLLKSFAASVGAFSASGWEPGTLSHLTHEDAVLLLQVAVKCADLGHLTLKWEDHLLWVHRLQDEFFAQGDKERALGLPVSFLMDREKPGVSETQVGFLKGMALPMFAAFTSVLPAAEPLMQGILANQQRWEQRAAAAS